MNNVQKEIFDTVNDIAGNLSEASLNDIMNGGVLFPSEGEKLNLMIIGQPHHALFDMSRKLAGADMFTVGRTDRSYKAKLTCGETFSCKLADIHGEYTEVSEKELESVLSDSGSSSSERYVEIEMAVNSPILQNMEIYLLCSAGDYEDFYWHPLFSRADLCIITLSAISLLSLSEKRFLKQTVRSLSGNKRFGIYINDFGMLDENGKKEVRESVEYFFKDDSELPIFYSPDKEASLCQKFNEFIQNNFMANRDAYKKLTVNQNLSVCINEAQEAAKRVKHVLTVDMDKIESAIKQLKSVSDSIEHKKKSSKRRIEIYINGSVKIQLMQKITDFNELLKSDINTNLASDGDFENMRLSLPKHIENSWIEFFETQQPVISSQIRHEMLKVGETIQKEIMDTITSDMDDDSGKLLFESISCKLRESMSATAFKSNHKTTEVLKYAAIGGAALLFLSIPSALIAIGGALTYRFINKSNAEASNRKNFINDVLAQCNDLSNTNISQIEKQFDDIIADLKNSVDNAYQIAFDNMLSALKERKEAVQNADDKLAYLNNVLESVIPMLKVRLSEV